MSNILNRAFETTVTSGTGTVNLAGAVASYDSLVTAATRDIGGSGPWTVYYVIEDDADYEMGTGTLTSGSPDTLARTTVHASSNSDAAVNWGSNIKNCFSWPPSSAVLPGLTYVAISASTTLGTGNRYVDTSTADRSHTLPLLSGTVASDRVHIAAGADGVKIVKHNASDSSGSALSVLFLDGDYVEFVSTGSAWVKTGERFSGVVNLSLTADDSIPLSTTEKVFDAGYAVDRDTTGQWDNVTNNRWDHLSTWPACDIRVTLNQVADDSTLLLQPYINGVANPAYPTVVGGYTSHRTFVHNFTSITGSDYLEFYCDNESSGSAHILMGDAASDETNATIEIVRWL